MGILNQGDFSGKAKAMDLREYMSLRCAYNLVRHEVPAESRLTFEEYAILSHLNECGELKTSEIADYQQVLRPTMTHRTNHLAELDLISRREGLVDRRNVCCRISPKGVEMLERLSSSVMESIPSGQPLHRSTAERIAVVADAMGQVFCTAGDLVLLGLGMSDGGVSSVSELVGTLGLLQPTVSMSVSTLVSDRKVERGLKASSKSRSIGLTLTEEGLSVERELERKIDGIIVHRHRSSALAE